MVALEISFTLDSNNRDTVEVSGHRELLIFIQHTWNWTSRAQNLAVGRTSDDGTVGERGGGGRLRRRRCCCLAVELWADVQHMDATTLLVSLFSPSSFYAMELKMMTQEMEGG